jgi:MFS family permease
MVACGEGLAVLMRNPQMLKVAVAAGVQSCAVSMIYALVVGPLKTKVWGHQQSEQQSEMAMATAIFSAVSSYYFGAFSDKVDRRLAVSIFGLCQFLPAWSLLAFGFDTTGLWVFMCLQVLAGLGVASNVMLILASDVTRPEDREFAFGLFYAISTFVGFLGSIPILCLVTLDVIPNNPRMTCWMHVGLSLTFFVLVLSIPRIEKEEVELPPIEIGRPADSAENRAGESQPDLEVCVNAQVPNPVVRDSAEVPAAAVVQERKAKGRICSKCDIWALIMPLKLLFEVHALGLICIVVVLIDFSKDLAFDIGGQFFMESLDLIKHGTHEKQQWVSILSSMPTNLTGIPALAFIGWLAKRYRPITMLWVMIPVGTVLIMSGCLMKWFPYMWFVPIVCITESFADLTRIPLNLFVTELAPKGRLGEAMGVVGMVKQIIGFLGNAVVVALNPPLQSSGLRNPLWVYYPACGLLRLLALLALPLVARQQESADSTQRLQKKTKTLDVQDVDAEVHARADAA